MSEDLLLQNDKNDVKEILKLWRNELGLDTYKQLAELLGVSQNTMESWKLRGKIPDKILYQYQVIKSKESSITKYKNNMLPFALDALVALTGNSDFVDSDNVIIKVINLKESLTFSKNFLGNSETLQAYKVEDNAMLPKFLKDDFVFFDEKDLGKNGFYLLKIEENFILRHIIFKAQNSIIIKSLDGMEDYELVLTDKVKILGRIVKVLSNL